eukprot:snap_masked-scaffold_30-processed-gene-2.30-mRNA-1 protein AED:1.00 eAED:1.00 QI:0/0/0/0/1/1/4/0/89
MSLCSTEGRVSLFRLSYQLQNMTHLTLMENKWSEKQFKHLLRLISSCENLEHLTIRELADISEPNNISTNIITKYLSKAHRCKISIPMV